MDGDHTSAPRRVLQHPDFLRMIFNGLDATSVTRASAVSQAWRREAGREGHWRDLLHRERHVPFCRDTAAAGPPCWALETPRVHGASPPRASWRQAYRLLAQWERARPSAEEPVPQVATERIRCDCFAPPGGQRLMQRQQHASIEAAQRHLGQYFDFDPFLFTALETSLRGRNRTITTLGQLAAVRDGRGNVTVIERVGAGLRMCPLPLRATNHLCHKVALLPVPPTRHNDVASDSTDVACITSVGIRSIRWEWRSGALQAVYPFPSGKPVALGEALYWLGWDSSRRVGPKSFGLYDWATGEPVLTTQVQHWISGCSILTPEFGPIVAWSPGLHLRVLWTTDAQKAELPQSLLGQGMPTDRPLKLAFKEGEQRAMGEDVEAFVVDFCDPERVALRLKNPQVDELGLGQFVRGWGRP